MSEKHYGDRDTMALDGAGSYYMRHVLAMTREGLHEKSKIAAELAWRDAELAWRDAEIDRLKEERAAAPVVLPEPVGAMSATRPRTVAWNCMFTPEAGTKLYTEHQVRALLATGGQAKAVLTGELIEAVDAWFARNTGLGGCSDKDVAELAAIFAAPQAQADARDAEQERWMGIGKAIERACVDLPAGAEINIHLEKDAGTVTLSDCDGDEQENFPTDEGFAGVVNAAIDAAISAAKGE